MAQFFGYQVPGWDSPLAPQSDSGRHARPGSRRRWLALKLPGGLNTKAGSFGLGDDRENLRPYQAKSHHFEDDTIYKLGNPKFPDPHPYTYISIYNAETHLYWPMLYKASQIGQQITTIYASWDGQVVCFVRLCFHVTGRSLVHGSWDHAQLAWDNRRYTYSIYIYMYIYVYIYVYIFFNLYIYIYYILYMYIYYIYIHIVYIYIAFPKSCLFRKMCLSGVRSSAPIKKKVSLSISTSGSLLNVTIHHSEIQFVVKSNLWFSIF